MNRDSDTTSLKLDATTARLLANIAETWGVSQEEALRRALEQANITTNLANKENWWETFKELQRRLQLTPAKAAEWQHSVREGRR
jgi:Zn-dependent peptidase ImmA (M78 family)